MSTSASAQSRSPISDRLDFIGLDEASLAQLRSAGKHIEKHLTPALERFYGKLAGVPAVTKFFEAQGSVQRAQGRQTGHWLSIATGKFDDEYVASSRKVGLRHAKIGRASCRERV